jgi:hypothetical protein
MAGVLCSAAGCAFFRSELTFAIHSAGTNAGGGGLVRFSGGGVSVYEERGRGFNIVVIDAATGHILAGPYNFDTFESEDGSAMRRLIAVVDQAPAGSLLLLAIGDDAGLNGFFTCAWRRAWAEDLARFLEGLGSRQIRSYCYRDSWAMATFKTTGANVAEGLSKTASVDLTVTLRLNREGLAGPSVIPAGP